MLGGRRQDRYLEGFGINKDGLNKEGANEGGFRRDGSKARITLLA